MESSFLQQFKDRYRNCASYTDRGKILFHGETVRFETVFLRGLGYRFLWRGKQDESDNVILVGPNDFEAARLASSPLHSELNSKILSTTGISRGIAPMIAKLLLPEEFDGVNFSPFDNVVETSVHDKLIEGRKCRCITSEVRPGLGTKAWIDEESFALMQFAIIADGPKLQPNMLAALEQMDPSLAITVRDVGETKSTVSEVIFESVRFSSDTNRGEFDVASE